MTYDPDRRYVLARGDDGTLALYAWFPGVTGHLDPDGNFIGGAFGCDDDRAMPWPQAKAALLEAMRKRRDRLNAEIACIETAGPDIAVLPGPYRCEDRTGHEAGGQR